MKKSWLLILVCIFIFLSGFYFIIPDHMVIRHNSFIQANATGLQRAILDEKKWEKWWPGQVVYNGKKQLLFYNGFFYDIQQRNQGSFAFIIKNKKYSTTATFNYIPVGDDSVLLNWTTDASTVSSPLRRFQAYFNSLKLRTDLNVILQMAHDFYSNPDHIYDIAICTSKVKDSILLFTSAVSKGVPTTESIYDLIIRLKKYATQQTAIQTGFPMLNISTTDSVHFLTKVALPVNKRLKPSGNISHKWMLGGGKILETEVHGGPSSIDSAFQKMQVYVADHHLVAPAIPFQSLITDRLSERDSSKWISKIYYPVM